MMKIKPVFKMFQIPFKMGEKFIEGIPFYGWMNFNKRDLKHV